MHHIVGVVAVGAILGQAARRSVWRPALRSAIKGGLVVAREAMALTQKVRAEASEIAAEAKAELSEEELHRSQSVPRRRQPPPIGQQLGPGKPSPVARQKSKVESIHAT
jgi:hypothetical protein